jgi:Holliday junction DNA helicase RuvA
MIASVSGVVAAVQPSGVVIEVGGIGVSVSCTPQTAAVARRGDALALHTSLVVREDSLTLYGFPDSEQRDVFELVQTVSGVGPRTALAVLATLSPDGLRNAIAAEDVASLTRVPGIGTKGAQRLIIELKDRLRAVARQGEAPAGDGQETVRAALVSLGWSARDADRAVAAVSSDLGADADVAPLLRAALQHLDRR